mmetsp:Transcript_41766/g.48099  ORF Transcript_41766/g.48099 Transcript_41766/m.48099 type:complete len:80 (+) Transcript_41766:272-511(+)
MRSISLDRILTLILCRREIMLPKSDPKRVFIFRRRKKDLSQKIATKLRSRFVEGTSFSTDSVTLSPNGFPLFLRKPKEK